LAPRYALGWAGQQMAPQASSGVNILPWAAGTDSGVSRSLGHGEQPLTTIAYLGDPQLWFESFQNWQSEFLSTAVLVLLSIFLRQRESPESKAVAAPHDQTGE